VAFGYMQSHRTVAGPDEVMWVARSFCEGKLPCDALIYLGTEFTPSGWNTRNGEFAWKPENFPKPGRMIDDLHAQHFKVVLHVVIEGRRMAGAVNEPCTPDKAVPSGRTPEDRWPDRSAVPCYWPYHKPLYDLGVHGMWPDQGDGLDEPSRLARIRMYWEGPQAYRPNERPFALRTRPLRQYSTGQEPGGRKPAHRRNTIASAVAESPSTSAAARTGSRSTFQQWRGRPPTLMQDSFLPAQTTPSNRRSVPRS
jgi:hypothetical protein